MSKTVSEQETPQPRAPGVPLCPKCAHPFRPFGNLLLRAFTQGRTLAVECGGCKAVLEFAVVMRTIDEAQLKEEFEDAEKPTKH